MQLQAIREKLNNIQEDYKIFESERIMGATQRVNGKFFSNVNKKLNDDEENEIEKENHETVKEKSDNEDILIENMMSTSNKNIKDSHNKENSKFMHFRSQSENFNYNFKVNVNTPSSNTKFSFMPNFNLEENNNKANDFLFEVKENKKKDNSQEVNDKTKNVNKFGNQISIAELLKRLSKKSKIEMDMKQRSFFNKIPHEYLNLENIATNNLNKVLNKSNKNKNSKEEVELRQQKEIILLNPSQWKKHENAWNYLTKFKSMCLLDIIPPNANDILVSNYFYHNPGSNVSLCEDYYKFIIDKSLTNPKTELKKWKKAYKSSIMRWHPDKLLPILSEMNLLTEDQRDSLIGLSGKYIDNMNEILTSVVEILKNLNDYQNSYVNK